MASSFSIPKSKAYLVFLNISFVLLFGLFCKTHLSSSSESILSSPNLALTTDTQEGCKELAKLKDYKAKCVYLKTQRSCDTNGYIDYLYLFYCLSGNWPSLGFTLVFLWLIVLFYLLGDTASVYFCSSLESLSKILKLSPTIAGVTLLSLGNGAPDLFSSLVSFTGNGSRSVGVNSVLGGAFFVSCIVVGVICVIVGPSQIYVVKFDFVRDVCFLLFGLSALLLIVIVGKINLWGALGFLALYIIYVFVVYKTNGHSNSDIEDGVSGIGSNYGDELGVPILRSFQTEEFIFAKEEELEANDNCDAEKICSSWKSSAPFGWFLYIIELPLSLPRRMTIPVVSEDNWSKPFAVISITIAPFFLALICDSQMSTTEFKTRLAIYIFGGSVGVLFGVLALFTTKTSCPPQKFLLPWLVVGFAMSVTWSYITANELVALLVSIGYIFGISPSILGLTVLAWGNSLGDLITNVAMSMKGGAEGTQVAISGCYAGPIFNLLVGLGLSQIVSTWGVYPSSLLVSKDLFLLETLAFLVIGLLWALVILPWRKMKLDRFLGIGLLVIYLGCISLRLVQTLGTL
ncbi:Cation/calcium exchanger [Thalictrum thalictroides]|uniref:Cation/calcium exchanger n=1 Tax=Thalictrum thalictroides TaxID=46969 RepID=A0A7J6WZW0_THATH|nr:Cation/calcium exchanger [Thalictrum thalictroides]